jgi:Flp pilus assembly protein TadG
MLRHQRTHGQALVEFALAATLIFFLLAAAVDVGLIFFALQGMHNAAQEGATYGSRWGVTLDASNNILIDRNAIIDHVRGESGAKGGNGFINLYDLDGNNVDDRTQNGYAEPNITIDVLEDFSSDGDPTRDIANSNAPENILCTDPSTTTKTCYMRVTVRSIHKMLFPFAPAFAKNVPLTSSFIMPLRSSLARANGSPPQAPKNCTVPNFIGVKKNSVNSLWAGAGFTGLLTVNGGGGGSTPIASQEIAANTVVPCSSSMQISS